MRGFGTRIFSNRNEPGSAVTRWVDDKLFDEATGMLAYQYGTGKAPSQQGIQAPQLIQDIRQAYNVKSITIEHILEELNSPKHNVICINDGDSTDAAAYDNLKGIILDAFSKKLPEKSSFEL